MRGRAYMRGAYTWNNTSVKENVGSSARGLYAGRVYRRRNAVFYFKSGKLFWGHPVEIVVHVSLLLVWW